ncbi:MAG: hypothetical protein V4725_09480 [Bacteroidota bacterium]|nr:hypothetical protein [Ferruginibacter sp.]
MKSTKFYLLLSLGILANVILQSCKKDDNPAPVPPKVQKLLYDWKIISITTPKVGQATDSSLLKGCMADDLIKFSLTGFDFQDGATKCDSSVFYYSKGNWSYNLASDSLQLGATTPSKYVSWKVVTLNDSIMQVKYTDSSNVLKKIVKTISFKH